MNYVEKHIGDFVKKTAHLSLLEKGVYNALLDVYYINEGPIPEKGPKNAARIIGARSAAEKTALKSVLDEFFQLQDGHWHQSRCNEEIERYKFGEPERETKKTNEELRVKRHREERASLFKVLNGKGHHAPWNTPIKDLRELVDRVTNGSGAAKPATPSVMPPATAPATPATATQTPVPSTHSPSPTSQTPDTNLGISSNGVADAPAVGTSEPVENGKATATPKPKRAAKPKDPAPSAATWDAYNAAYTKRYGVAAMRNAKVNAHLARFVELVGSEEAPAVAEFFLGHRNALYVNAAHATELLVRDAEKLRMEWATGRKSATQNGHGHVDIAARDAEAKRLLGFKDPQGKFDA